MRTKEGRYKVGLGQWRSMFYCLLILLSSLILMYREKEIAETMEIYRRMKDGYSCANICIDAKMHLAQIGDAVQFDASTRWVRKQMRRAA
jgi:hypothetical protein